MLYCCTVPGLTLVIQAYFQEILVHKGGLNKSDLCYHGNLSLQTTRVLVRLIKQCCNQCVRLKHSIFSLKVSLYCCTATTSQSALHVKMVLTQAALKACAHILFSLKYVHSVCFLMYSDENEAKNQL